MEAGISSGLVVASQVGLGEVGCARDWKPWRGGMVGYWMSS